MNKEIKNNKPCKCVLRSQNISPQKEKLFTTNVLFKSISKVNLSNSPPKTHHMSCSNKISKGRKETQNSATNKNLAIRYMQDDHIQKLEQKRRSELLYLKCYQQAGHIIKSPSPSALNSLPQKRNKFYSTEIQRIRYNKKPRPRDIIP
jgi:hypothetical protein